MSYNYNSTLEIRKRQTMHGIVSAMRPGEAYSKKEIMQALGIHASESTYEQIQALIKEQNKAHKVMLHIHSILNNPIE